MKRSAFAACLVFACAGVSAGEGMWTPDNLPLQMLQQKYGFTPDAGWIGHAQRAAVRTSNCSGSFISPQGLVLTNHHCVHTCVQQLSTAQRDFVQSGFYAKEQNDEVKCPEIELNRLEAITDVTARVKEATAGKTGEAFSRAEKAVKSDIEKECSGADAATTRCDVVSLYHGGIYDLYKYHRFEDVRLVFAPEAAIAAFGGDPDNFNFPRYALDMGVLRAYEDGKPAVVRDFFPFSRNGAGDGEPTIVIGHPGGTERQWTVAQLETLRDVDLVYELVALAEHRGVLEQFGSESAEHQRIAEDDISEDENFFKEVRGWVETLSDAKVFDLKRRQETELRAWVDADPARKAKYAKAWDEIAVAQSAYRNLATRHRFLEGGARPDSKYYTYARQLVRGAAERAKPNNERLREYSDARLPNVTRSLFSTAPVHPELEKVTLALSLTKLREWLGADDPFVRDVLGKESPRALASRLVDATKLGDPAVRKALWNDADALAKSDDPFIELARRIDPAARAIRKRKENEVDAIVDRNSELIAAARFEKYGTSVYPDGTFTLRFSFGEVKGWEQNGAMVPPFTEIGGVFARATGSEPFALPRSWLDAKDRLNAQQRFDFVTTNDVIGGNSGSPAINRSGEIVGLVFDGNIESLGGEYWYDERANRTVLVHTGAILETLHKVYGAERLAGEIESARTH